MCCPAKGKATNDVLRGRPDLPAKVSFLQRYDRDCGDIYGVLPLMIGIPGRND